MARFECENCGAEQKHVKKGHRGGHKVTRRSVKEAECLDCDTVFDIPNCCGKEMMVAS